MSIQKGQALSEFLLITVLIIPFIIGGITLFRLELDRLDCFKKSEAFARAKMIEASLGTIKTDGRIKLSKSQIEIKYQCGGLIKDQNETLIFFPVEEFNVQ